MQYTLSVCPSRLSPLGYNSLPTPAISKCQLYSVGDGFVLVVRSPNFELDLDILPCGALVYSPYGECSPVECLCESTDLNHNFLLRACKIMETHTVSGVNGETVYCLARVPFRSVPDEDALLVECRDWITNRGWGNTLPVGEWCAQPILDKSGE